MQNYNLLCIKHIDNYNIPYTYCSVLVMAIIFVMGTLEIMLTIVVIF